MYRHIVMFWLKDKSPESLALAREKLLSLSGKIEGLLSVEVEPDALRSERSCDLCLNMLFDTRASLDAYRTHPAHIPVQQHMHAVREKSCAADYPLTQPTRRMPKLYALMGPSSREAPVLGSLIDAGMDGITISLEHLPLEDALPIVEAYTNAAAARGIAPEVLLDHVPNGAIPDYMARSGATGLIQSLRLTDIGHADFRRVVGAGTRVLCRVDCPEDVDTLPTLMANADELIIARGGLGRNFEPHELPRLQKHISGLACAAGVPFMLATDLLSSMVRYPVPSAADLMDIHNAVHDGASSLMTMRETALGEYPAQAMAMLRRTAEEALR